MGDVYASAINKLKGNVRIKDAVIHCDAPLLGERDDAKILISHCSFLLENDFCCIWYPNGY